MNPDVTVGPLAEHTERVLTGTGLGVDAATRIAASHVDAGTWLTPKVVEALRDGWAGPELARGIETCHTETRGEGS